MSSRAVAAGRLTSLCLSIRITPIRVRGGVYNPFRDRPWSFLFIYPPTYAWLAGMSQMFMAKTNFQSRIICMRNVTNIFLNTKLFFLNFAKSNRGSYPAGGWVGHGHGRAPRPNRIDSVPEAPALMSHGRRAPPVAFEAW